MTHTTTHPSCGRSMWCSASARVLAATRSYVVVDAHKSHGGTPWKKDALSGGARRLRRAVPSSSTNDRL